MRLDRNGTILVASLWILAILSILAIGVGFRISLEVRLSRYNMDRLKALYLAKAGVVKSQELLSKDNNDYDSIYECGIALTGDETPSQIFLNNRLGEGSFSISYRAEGADYQGMMDEERKININTAPQNVLENLLNGVNENITIAASIIAWRSPPPGIDDAYYESLEHPYQCKHGKFSTPEELLLVKGINQQLFDKIKDYITVFGSAEAFTVNINTASEKVLFAILDTPELAEIGIDAIISEIMGFRKGNDGIIGTADDGIYRDIGRIPLPTQAESLRNSFTIKSDYFRIESKGAIDRSKTEKKLAAIATKDAGGNYKLVSYHEL